jgi:hypothetical protein
MHIAADGVYHGVPEGSLVLYSIAEYSYLEKRRAEVTPETLAQFMDGTRKIVPTYGKAKVSAPQA